MAEMLVQSDMNKIYLLPAISDDWKVEGEVKGLKARGGFEIDMAWKNGKVVQLYIKSVPGGKTTLFVNGSSKEIQIAKGKKVRIL